MIGLAWVHGALHQFETSIQWAQKSLSMDSDISEAYGLLGDAALEMGDYDAAFEHYQKMLDIRPDLSSYSRAGHLLFVTGDIQGAIGLMQKAIAAGAPFAENTAWCRAELANMLWSKGDLPMAEQVIHTGLKGHDTTRIDPKGLVLGLGTMAYLMITAIFQTIDSLGTR